MRARRAFVVFVAAGLLHLLYLHNLSSGWLDPLFNDTTHRIGQGLDFYQFYQSGHDLAAGRSIYLDRSDQVVPYLCWNHYPPAVALTLGRAVGLLHPRGAYLLWVVVLELCVAAAVWITVRRPRDRALGLHTGAMWLAFSPLVPELYMGQVNAVVALLLLVFLVAGTRRPLRGALCYGAAVTAKLNLLCLAPALLRLRRPGPLLAAAALTLATALPHVVAHPGDARFLLEYLFAPPDASYMHAGNLGLSVWIAHLTGSQLVARGVGLALLAGAAGLTLRGRGGGALDLHALWICAYLLAFRFVWEHHYLLLLPVLALLYQRDRGRAQLAAYALLALPTPFALLDGPAGPGFPDPSRYWSLAEKLVYHGVKPAGVLLLALDAARRIAAPPAGGTRPAVVGAPAPER